MASTTMHETYTTPLVPASTATLTLAARHTCSAPAALVFRTLRNTETWRDWNRFCPRVTIRAQPDDSDEREAMEFWAARAGHFGGPDKAAQGVQRSHAETTERRRASLQVSGDSTTSSAATAAAPAAGSVEVDSGDPHPRASTGRLFGGRGGGRKSVDESATARRPSGQPTASPHTHVARNLRQMGGEPSVRLKHGTRMTLHVRMKLPYKLTDYTDTALVVTEVSRPNDPVNDDYEDNTSNSLTATPTHTSDAKSGIYRISWASDSDGGGGYPKFMLQAQRVHEIRPIVDPANINADGTSMGVVGETGGCEIVTWECQRGVLAKVVKKLYGRYLQERFEEWVKSLGDYCEEFAGKVDRRDFGSMAAVGARGGARAGGGGGA